MRQTLPELWLLTDARNDAVLEAAIEGLPPASGIVYRHRHLSPEARRARFAALAPLVRARGHGLVLAGDPREAQEWGADGAYGPPDLLGATGAGLRLATVHDEAELAAAERAGADAAFVSPVFPTRSHPGAATLGVEGFRRLEKLAAIPLIALGGMSAARANALGCRRWGAIDGLSGGLVLPQDS